MTTKNKGGRPRKSIEEKTRHGTLRPGREREYERRRPKVLEADFETLTQKMIDAILDPCFDPTFEGAPWPDDLAPGPAKVVVTITLAPLPRRETTR